MTDSKPARPTKDELAAIARGGTMSADISRYLRECDHDGSVAAELTTLRTQSGSPDPEATLSSDQTNSEDRFLQEFADAHAAGDLGQSSLVAMPAAAGYEVEHELSRGAQGAVFLAKQTATRRPVALKVLLRGAFASDRQLVRFEREVEMVAALNHPGIVTVYDSGVSDDGRAWLAMEFIDGVTLDKWLANHARGHSSTRTQLSAALLAQVCDAVVAAHQRGVIHRDLKPDNILVDEDGQPHILDFGLAKPVEAGDWDSSKLEVTAAGEFMGTFAYASPEQVSGDPDLIDVRTDVFAIGVMLYEAMVGSRPLQLDGGLNDVIQAISTCAIRPPRSMNPSLSRDCETILLRALDRDPDRRYQSPAELARDLRHWLAGEPIEARRDDAWYVAGKFLCRHWLPMSAGAIGIIMLFAFATTMYILWDRATEANKRLTGTVGMVSEVLGSADAENFTQPLAAASIGDMLDRWLNILESDLGDYPQIAASIRLDLAENHIGAGRWDESAAALAAAEDTIDLDPSSPSTRAGRLLHARGRLLYKLADYEASRDAYAAALQHRQAIDPDGELTAETTMHLAAATRNAGDDQAAEALFNLALERTRQLVDTANDVRTRTRRRAALANLLNSMAVSNMVDDPESAIGPLQEALDIFEQDGSDPNRDWRVASLQHNIGECLRRMGRHEEAQAALTRALATKRLQGNTLSEASTEAALSRLALARLDTSAARAHFHAASELRGDRLAPTHPSIRDANLIEIELLIQEGRLEQIPERLVSLHERSQSPASKATIMRLEGLLLEARGERQAAQERLQEAHALMIKALGEQSAKARRIKWDLQRINEAPSDTPR
ncbi:MAG: serine/threonine-protein kinase [Phycisphaerales bacterium]|nr:serine/threonine-protein kinase [Phycisphaerales bacterium]